MEKQPPQRRGNWVERMGWHIPVIGSLTLGLAPFVPQPHLVEKLVMLFQGELSRPLDIFDLCLHGAFPVLLLVKAGFALARRPADPGGG